ncbi:MAG TPA: hypothetical protein VGH63_10340, partial [Polyangia bacterium]
MRSNVILAFVLALATVGCSSKNGGGGGGSGGTGGGGSGGTAGGGSGGTGGGSGGDGGMTLPPGTTMTRFISTQFTVNSGQEFYWCA